MYCYRIDSINQRLKVIEYKSTCIDQYMIFCSQIGVDYGYISEVAKSDWYDYIYII